MLLVTLLMLGFLTLNSMSTGFLEESSTKVRRAYDWFRESGRGFGSWTDRIQAGLLDLEKNRGYSGVDDLRNRIGEYEGRVKVVPANPAWRWDREAIFYFPEQAGKPATAIDPHAKKEDPTPINVGRNVYFRMPEQNIYLNPASNLCAGRGVCGPMSLQGAVHGGNRSLGRVGQDLQRLHFKNTGQVFNTFEGSPTSAIQDYVSLMDGNSVSLHDNIFTDMEPAAIRMALNRIESEYPNSIMHVIPKFAKNQSHVLEVRDGLQVARERSDSYDDQTIGFINWITTPTKNRLGSLADLADLDVGIQSKLAEQGRYYNDPRPLSGTNWQSTFNREWVPLFDQLDRLGSR